MAKVSKLIGSNALSKLLFIIYFLALTWIILLKMGVRFTYMEDRQIYLIPFYEPLFLDGTFDLGEIIMNIVIFVPLGIYTGVLYMHSSWRNHISIFLTITLLFESLQYVFRLGSFDATDLLNNTLGGIIGLGIWKQMEKLTMRKELAQKITNGIALTLTILMLTLLILLKLNKLPIRYQ